MSSNYLRCFVITIGVAFLLICSILFFVYFLRSAPPRRPQPEIENCPRPKTFSTDYDFDFTKKSGETQNLNGKIDFFLLSYSWSPTFCSNPIFQNQFQCENHFEFIVHGLWPSSRTGSHPRNCRNEPMISKDLIEKYFCLMPSETLMQAEWEKHGTCFWTQAEDYFHRIQQLHSNIRFVKNFQKIFDDSTLNKKGRENAIKQVFLVENPQIPRSAIRVMTKDGGKTLKEIHFCFDRHFVYTNC